MDMEIQLGFGNKRLKKFYDNFSRGIEALIRRYEMEQGDDVWLCTYKLKEIGCDPALWPKRNGVTPKKYGLSLQKKHLHKPFTPYQYIPITPKNLPYMRRTY